MPGNQNPPILERFCRWITRVWLRVRKAIKTYVIGSRISVAGEKHHESNLLWGPISIFVGIVITVIAAMKHDLRWLLLVAWPVGVFGIASLSRQIAYKRLRIFTVVLSGLVIAGGLYRLDMWLKPNETNQNQQFSSPLTLEFKFFPEFTPMVKQSISQEMGSFYQYLLSIGFDVPKKVPTITLSTDPNVTAAELSTFPSYYGFLAINKNALTSPEQIRLVYGGYVFRDLLATSNANMPGRIARVGASGLFANYYNSSLENRKLSAPNPPGIKVTWLDVLWIARQQFGKEFMDKAMYYTYLAFVDSSSKNDRVNPKQYTCDRLIQGIGVLDPDGSHVRSFQKIVSDSGLLVSGSH